MKIKVLMTNGFEETEAVSLIDILRRAGYDLMTVSVTGEKTVKGNHNIEMITDSIMEETDFAGTEVLVLPGGPGVKNLIKDHRVIDLVKKFDADKKYIAAICAAPEVLEKAGVLHGKTVTVYPASESEIKSARIERKDVIVDGRIITGRGMGTAIPMGLKMVEIFTSREASEELRKKIVYNMT